MQCCGLRLLAASLLVTVPVGLVEAAQPDNVTIPPGYTITRVNPPVSLTSPTAMTFYGDTIWVTEVGGTVKQIDNLGNVTTQLTAAQLPAGTLDSPLTGIIFARDWFWLVHRKKNPDGVDVGVVSRAPNVSDDTKRTSQCTMPHWDHACGSRVSTDRQRLGRSVRGQYRRQSKPPRRSRGPV